MNLPLVIGISGASGAPYAVRMLQVLRGQSTPTHLVISKSAARALKEESGLAVDDVRALAAANYSNSDLGAAQSAGAYRRWRECYKALTDHPPSITASLEARSIGCHT